MTTLLPVRRRIRKVSLWSFLALCIFCCHCPSVNGAEARGPDTIISPQPKESGSSRDSGGNSQVYLLGVVTLIGIGAWLWVRSSRKGMVLNSKKASITIDEVRPLGNKQHLVLVSCRGQSFLVGVSADRIVPISTLPPASGSE